MMEFTTRVENVDIYNGWAASSSPEKDSVMGTALFADVKWSIELEACSWGVKNINIAVQSVQCDVTLQKEAEAGYEESEIAVNSSDGWTIVDIEKEDRAHDVISPENVQIDYYDKTIIVTF